MCMKSTRHCLLLTRVWSEHKDKEMSLSMRPLRKRKSLYYDCKVRNRAVICVRNEPKLELARNLGEYCDSEPVRARSFRRISIWERIYFLWCLWSFKIGSCYPLGTTGLSEPEKGLWISWSIGGVAMSRNIRVSEPSAEMQIKIIRAKDAIASQKPRTVRCPYCRHNSIIVFEDTRGHVQTKCKACGRETVFNVLEMRRLRRLQLYYSSLNGWDDNK